MSTKNLDKYFDVHQAKNSLLKVWILSCKRILDNDLICLLNSEQWTLLWYNRSLILLTKLRTQNSKPLEKTRFLWYYTINSALRMYFILITDDRTLQDINYKKDYLQYGLSPPL